MRVLVACPSCRRQFDAGMLDVGSSFHCHCGSILSVPAPAPHEASVVRCSSCGGPRHQGLQHCSYCGADFTLHERDLHTLCPGCMARISDQANFCHACGTAILASSAAGEASDKSCPACGGSHAMSSRSLGDEEISVLECSRCAGIWLDEASFHLLVERARRSAPPSAVEALKEWNPPSIATDRRDRGPLYRPCPVCSKLMNRRNYGLKSGIIIDSCRGHGFWFDARELDGIVGWIRKGGDEIAERHRRDVERAERRPPPDLSVLEPAGTSAGKAGSLIELLSWLGTLIVR